MTGKKDLVTMESAAETLGIDEDEVAGLLKTGELRKVWHRAGNDSEAPLDSFIMASDVRRLQQETDPKYLAAVVRGEIVEDDDEGDNARTLAAKMPRL